MYMHIFLWDKRLDQCLNIQGGTCQNHLPVGINRSSHARLSICVRHHRGLDPIGVFSSEHDLGPLAKDLQSYLGQWGRGAEATGWPLQC